MKQNSVVSIGNQRSVDTRDTPSEMWRKSNRKYKRSISPYREGYVQYMERGG